MAPSAPERRVVRFDVYEVDLPAGYLRKRGTRIRLRDQSLRVLAMLLERPGEVVARAELQKRLWPQDVFVDFENNLNAVIARLREALGDSAERPRYIETVSKRGYRFIAAVAEIVPAPSRAAAARTRVAVLPFVNLSGDPGQEYFSDAITEEIINALASLAPERLAVIARTTAMHYKGSRKEVVRIGRELGVEYVVEGSAQPTQDRVAICVQLIQVGNQAHLWAKRYDPEPGGIPGTPGEIAQAIADKLGVDTQAGGRARRFPTTDLGAYHLYLRGRYHLGKYTPENIGKARECFENAIARDPEFALAYDSLAELFFFLGLFGFARPADVLSAGIFHVVRALEIDNTLAKTHALLAMYRKELDYNWAEVQRESARALELNPASPLVRFRYGISGPMPQGRIPEAVAEIVLALEPDPLNVYVRCWLALILYFGRQYGRALEEARLALELDPSHFLGYVAIGLVRCEEQRFDEANDALRRAAELSGGIPLVLGWLGLSLGRSGNAAEARSILERLTAIGRETYVPPTSIAAIHLGLGEIDAAFDWMDRAVDARDPILIPIKSVPYLDPIRADPRYLALLRRMKLEP
jgi:TolB-like protein/Tfp pilus assembly protein PilF